MDGFLERFGMSALAFVPMRRRPDSVGVIGMGRGPGRPAYTPDELEAAQRIADGAAANLDEPGLLAALLRDGGPDARGTERRFRTLVERLPAIVYEAEPAP